ncbi:MAG: hypothetical protein KJ621_15465 [Proteobacteria bacterium]|nr:hypothetical protein [Pseudomonadota bacterium]MBU1743177.1 hypothetical protein [Pseudomonadota bacterium]
MAPESETEQRGPLERIRLASTGPARNVEAEAVWIGGDLLVYIFGGEAPHIGAVAAATPRPSLRDPHERSATASVLTFVGHKEDDLAKQAAERLAAALDTNVVVTAGIHWDDLPADDIEQVMANGRELIQELIARLRK